MKLPSFLSCFIAVPELNSSNPIIPEQLRLRALSIKNVNAGS